MATDRRRLLELALRGLESERNRINSEIEVVQTELHGRTFGAKPASKAPRRRKPRLSPAERRRRADRMRQYWADRPGGTTGTAGARGSGRKKPKFSAAERKRRAERMRQYWLARRKADKR